MKKSTILIANIFLITLVTMATTNDYDVVIVGAGFAGLGW